MMAEPPRAPVGKNPELDALLLEVLREMGPPVPDEVMIEYRQKNPDYAELLAELNLDWAAGLAHGDPYETLTALYHAANAPLILDDESVARYRR
jgi:hypothetical protein